MRAEIMIANDVFAVEHFDFTKIFLEDKCVRKDTKIILKIDSEKQNLNIHLPVKNITGNEVEIDVASMSVEMQAAWQYVCDLASQSFFDNPNFEKMEISQNKQVYFSENTQMPVSFKVMGIIAVMLGIIAFIWMYQILSVDSKKAVVIPSTQVIFLESPALDMKIESGELLSQGQVFATYQESKPDPKLLVDLELLYSQKLSYEREIPVWKSQNASKVTKEQKAVEVAKNHFSTAKKQLEVEKNQLTRFATLLKEKQLSQSAYDAQKSRVNTAESALKNAQLNLEQAQSNLELARIGGDLDCKGGSGCYNPEKLLEQTNVRIAALELEIKKFPKPLISPCDCLYYSEIARDVNTPFVFHFLNQKEGKAVLQVAFVLPSSSVDSIIGKTGVLDLGDKKITFQNIKLASSQDILGVPKNFVHTQEVLLVGEIDESDVSLLSRFGTVKLWYFCNNKKSGANLAFIFVWKILKITTLKTYFWLFFMKIWILYKYEKHIIWNYVFAMNAFFALAEKNNFSLEVVTPDILRKNIFSSLPDVILTRMWAETPQDIFPILQKYQSFWVRIINTPESVALCADKFQAYQKLQDINIDFPFSLLLVEYLKKRDKIAFPIILKKRFWMKGEWVFLFENTEKFENFLWNISQDEYEKFIVQEYVATSYWRDVRVFMLWKKCLWSMLRIAPEWEFRTNIAQWSKGEKFDIDENTLQLCQKIMQKFSLDIAGIDLLFWETWWKVCEVNSSPWFEEIQKFVLINIAEKIFESLK